MVVAIFRDFWSRNLDRVLSGNESNKRRNERKMTGRAYGKARKGEQEGTRLKKKEEK